MYSLKIKVMAIDIRGYNEWRKKKEKKGKKKMMDTKYVIKL